MTEKPAAAASEPAVEFTACERGGNASELHELLSTSEPLNIFRVAIAVSELKGFAKCLSAYLHS